MASNSYYQGQQTPMQPYPQQQYPPQQYPQQYPPQQHGGGYAPNQPMDAGYQQQTQQPPPPYSYTPIVPPQGEKQDFQQTFKPKDRSRFHDLWAGILFLACVGGTAAITVIGVRAFVMSNPKFGNGGINGNSSTRGRKPVDGLTSNTVVAFAIVLGVAFVLSYIYLLMARAFTKQIIYITGILNVVFAFVTAFYMFATRAYTGGILLLIGAIFLAICFWSWRSRIPFTVLMLRTSVDVSKKYGHPYLVSIIGGMIGLLSAIWWSITVIGIHAAFDPKTGRNAGRSAGALYGLIAFVTFTMFWFTEWLKNTIHVIISGVFGSWYFCSRNMPTGITRGATKRALTTSFGSISLGSLLVAIIQLLRQIAASAMQQQAADGDIIGCMCACVAQCCLGILDWLVEFINRYAFSHIALYGKSYVAAAKDTWTMIKQRGIDALINECLLGPVLGFGSLFVGYACALTAFIFLRVTNNYTGNSFAPFIIVFSLLIGSQVANIFTTPMTSGIDTIFVGMAWDPEVMIRDHPDLYHQMVQVYPQVQNTLHV